MYALDLRHEVQTCTLRRLWTLVKGLPSRWTVQDEMAALLVERTDMWWATWVAMNAQKPSKVESPIAIQHPDRPAKEPPPQKRAVGPAQIARLFGGG